ncbi:MAG: HAMP domain-containing histidine kinase [Lachnospiraceae bacterium]|nr:HAMP domain-containing histidine kinase [Lachnospiraceae bacterium]
MKYLRRIILIFVLFMLIMLGVLIVANRAFTFNKRDIVEYNDYLHEVQYALERGEAEEDIEKKYDCSIILSNEIENPELAKKYEESALILDLSVNGEYVGKVAFTDRKDYFNETKTVMFQMIMIIWAAFLIGGLFIFFLMFILFVKPLREMEKFCGKIAKGDLDEALPIHRTETMFEPLISAFDLMREELKSSRTREMEAEKARKELVTDLSHDIKTPLSVIQAACEMLEVRFKRRLFDNQKKLREAEKENSDTEALNIAINEIEDNLKKVSTISGKTETISALMSNVMHATLEDMDKLEVFAKEEDSRGITEMFTALTNYGNIVLENEVIPCLVYMDKLRLEQAIDNVVSNSYKYAGTDINVSFSEKEAGPDKDKYLCIKIRDFGPGVKEEDIPLLCEKYFRGSNSDDKNGYGLGLYLVRWYMEQQGGGFEYYNDNGFVAELLLKKV